MSTSGREQLGGGAKTLAQIKEGIGKKKVSSSKTRKTSPEKPATPPRQSPRKRAIAEEGKHNMRMYCFLTMYHVKLPLQISTKVMTVP